MPPPNDTPATVAFLCRGSVAEGLGHVMRTATVAAEVTKRGRNVLVVVIGDGTATGILEEGPTPYRSVATEEAAAEVVGEADPAVLVFDLLSIDDEVFADLAPGRRTVSLSPVFDHLDAVDRSFSRGAEPGAADDPRHRRGLAYAVIRSDVQPLRHAEYVEALYEDPLSVGIAMGGTDAADRTRQVLEELRPLPEPTLFWAMLGEGYAHSYENLVEVVRADRRHEIVLAKTGRSMWSVLRRCSVLILAGGITTYEATFAGIPSINLIEHEDRMFLVGELVKAGGAEALPMRGAWGDRLRGLLAEMAADRDRLFLMHRAARALVDGKGAGRIAEEIFSLAEQQFMA